MLKLVKLNNSVLMAHPAVRANTKWTEDVMGNG
jgi:hypothetical protein